MVQFALNRWKINQGEKIYKAPLELAQQFLLITKLFDEAGVSYPTADWTWEGEFFEAAKKLSKPRNQWVMDLIGACT